MYLKLHLLSNVTHGKLCSHMVQQKCEHMLTEIQCKIQSHSIIKNRWPAMWSS